MMWIPFCVQIGAAVEYGSARPSSSCSIAGLTATSGKKITTSGTKSLADDGNVAVSNGDFSTTLDAQSISTMVFVGNSVSVEPRVTPQTAPSTGVYEIFAASGSRIGQVLVGEGDALVGQIGKISSRPGLYFAKSRDHETIPVVLP